MADTHKPLKLHTGNLHVLLQNGFLRYIKLGSQELVRMIYFALRDANWGTLPHRIDGIKLNESSDGFSLQYHCFCKDKEIDFRWKCKIMGKGNTLSFEIHGKAHSNFKVNRIGFCVLHPIDGCEGKEVRITHPNGEVTTQHFPKTIAPNQPFKDIRKMLWQTDTSEIRLSFEGDVFETEDQRNWLDASYKTYCTPLELPFPVQIKIGDVVSQRICLEVVPKSLDIPSETELENSLQILHTSSPLPRLGLEANHHLPSDWGLQRLKDLQLSFVRVEIRLDKEDKEQKFLPKLLLAKRLELPIELVLCIGPDVTILKNQLDKIDWEGLDILNVLPLNTATLTTKKDFLQKVRPILRTFFGDVPIGGGTDYYFAQVNRERPPANSIDFLSFSANPQVHAFDDLSLLETTQTFKGIIKSARIIAAEKPVHISPITLRPRSNPDATISISEEESAKARLDYRHNKVLNALWTLVSLKNIVQGGAEQVTFFQTIGDEGVLSDTDKSVFPIYEIFAFLGQKKNAVFLHTKSSHPLIFDGLVLEENGKRHYLLANFTTKTIQVHLDQRYAELQPRGLTFLE